MTDEAPPDRTAEAETTMNARAAADPGAAAAPRAAAARRVTRRVASALGGAADHVGTAAETAASAVGSAAENAASAVGAAVGATVRRFDERPGARVRRVRRMGREPLRYLYSEQPDARNRTRRELGIQTIDVADIAGTAVGGAQQRGGDFLPLKAFRSPNWSARWQRLGRAADRLAILPPIDVVRSGDKYWVLDGHNRVALALYTGQASIDADVVDLVDPSAPRTEQPESFASLAEDSRELRAAVSRGGRHTGGPASEAPAERERPTDRPTGAEQATDP